MTSIAERVRSLHTKIAQFSIDDTASASAENHSLTLKENGIERLVAAVLVLLRWDNLENRWYVLLTLRSEHLRRNAGQVAFPGGGRERCDPTLRATALREAWEEVGVEEQSVHVLGVLPAVPGLTVSVTPVLAVLEQHSSFVPKPDPNEVDLCFWLPLERFLTHEGHGYVNGTHAFEDWVGPEETAVYTWGLTSFISILTAMIVFEKRPVFSFPTNSAFLAALFTDSTWKEVLIEIFHSRYYDMKSLQLRAKL